MNLLSLFDYSGSWSKPWRDNGYNVYQVDIKLGIDVYSPIPDRDYDVILAAPPCTDFAASGAQYWKQKDMDGRTSKSLSLIYRTLSIIEIFKPRVWALENPVGRLNKLVPELQEFGPWYFQPYWYGDPYTKKTGLWGKFNRNLKRNEVEPIKYCKQGSWLQQLGGSSERTKELRSMTPKGFASAFYEANKLG